MAEHEAIAAEHRASAFALSEIASQIQDWLTWNKEHRAVEGLTTDVANAF